MTSLKARLPVNLLVLGNLDNSILSTTAPYRYPEDLRGGIDVRSIGETIFKGVLEIAWSDGRITRDERDLLETIRLSLNLSEKKCNKLEQEVLNKLLGEMEEI